MTSNIDELVKMIDQQLLLKLLDAMILEQPSAKSSDEDCS